MGNQQQQGKGRSTNNNNNSNPYGIKKSQEEIHFNAFNVMKGYSNQKQMNSLYNQQQGVSPNPSQQLTRAMSFQPKYKYTITAKMLRDTFKTYAIDGQYLNKDRFDDAIESIFRFPDLPEMHYTYLSEKIFYLIDDSGDGKIQEDEFVPGLSNVLSDRNFRIQCKTITHINLYSINDGNDDNSRPK